MSLFNLVTNGERERRVIGALVTKAEAEEQAQLHSERVAIRTELDQEAKAFGPKLAHALAELKRAEAKAADLFRQWSEALAAQDSAARAVWSLDHVHTQLVADRERRLQDTAPRVISALVSDLVERRSRILATANGAAHLLRTTEREEIDQRSFIGSVFHETEMFSSEASARRIADRLSELIVETGAVALRPDLNLAEELARIRKAADALGEPKVEKKTA